MRTLVVTGLLAGFALMALPSAASATVVGNGGTDTAPDGSIGLPPTGDHTVNYVSTYGGITGVGANPDGSSHDPTDGSTFSTSTFMPGVGGSLSFYFNYISSDGTQSGTSFPDNAWADLMNASTGAVAAVLFSSTTTSFTPLAGTTASVLGTYSGTCYGPGCGNTGWQSASYHFSDNNTYFLKFGVVNSIDQIYDSAMFFDGAIEDGMPIPTPVPEPATLALLGAAVVSLMMVQRRRFS